MRAFEGGAAVSVSVSAAIDVAGSDCICVYVPEWVYLNMCRLAIFKHFLDVYLYLVFLVCLSIGVSVYFKQVLLPNCNVSTCLWGDC